MLPIALCVLIDMFFVECADMVCYTVVTEEIGPPWILKGSKMRTAVQVIREIALVKANTKGNPLMQKALLAPLEAELQAIAEFQQRQGTLALEAEAAAKTGVKAVQK